MEQEPPKTEAYMWVMLNNFKTSNASVIIYTC